ncbi:hypothetical protein ACFXPA_48245, partial [Amycolatopsis sp. NPDC059090]
IAGRSADPGVKAALGDAKGALDKAIDSVEHPTQMAFRSAGVPSSASPLHDFLGGSSPAGDVAGGPGGGALAPGHGGGGGGGGGTPYHPAVLSSGPGGAAGGPSGQVPAQFDTDVAQQRGMSQAGGTPQQAALEPGGTPGGGAGGQGAAQMGGMPMGGGMGGMGGGGQQNKERDPQIWLQADKGAWSGDEHAPDSTVLGRSEHP